MGISTNNNKIVTVGECNTSGGNIPIAGNACPTCRHIKNYVKNGKTISVNGNYADNQLVQTKDITYGTPPPPDPPPGGGDGTGSYDFSNPQDCGGNGNFIIILATPDGRSFKFRCKEYEYILDKAEECGIELYYSCRAGACCNCVGKIVSGQVDQSAQTYLSDDDIAKNICLLCVSYPKPDNLGGPEYVIKILANYEEYYWS